MNNERAETNGSTGSSALHFVPSLLGLPYKNRAGGAGKRIPMRPLHSTDSTNLYPLLHNALRNPEAHWQSLARGLLNYHQAGRMKRPVPESARQALLDEFALVYPTDAKLLITRFVEEATVAELAHEMGFSQDQLNRLQRRAIERLADLVRGNEFGHRKNYHRTMRLALPAHFSGALFGYENEKQLLRSFLTEQISPWICAISGPAGVGKTRLLAYSINEVVHSHLLHSFAWLNAAEIFQEELITTLLSLLAVQPAMLIIDGFDQEESLEQLVDILLPNTRTTKVIITTRIRPVPNIDTLYLRIRGLEQKYFFHFAHDVLSNYGNHALHAEFKQHAASVHTICRGNPRSFYMLLRLATHSGFQPAIKRLTKLQ